ncbi:MAG: DASS family sodium-coupled anion symporter [Negativicutes bacterium]|nr:DASS family sodium-coupled anion symporter [Negativicutes bacterium]
MKRKLFWLALAIISMLGIMFASPFEGLSVAGQKVLAVLVFAVIVWITEAISYPLSGIAIITFLILSLGFAPASTAGTALLGTGKAIPLALSGFTNSGWVLVAAGLFLAAIILETGLEKRMALTILKFCGTKANNIVLSMILAMYVFAFFIPSIIARAATLTPIALGLIDTLKLSRKSTFAKALLLAIALSSSISGLGVLSGAAQSPVVVSFVEKITGKSISWLDWLIYGEPFGIVLAIVLYFLLTRMMKFEFDEVPGGKAIVAQELQALGPMSRTEKKVFLILLATILAWATEPWHKIDANSVSIISVMVLLSPGIGVAEWKSVAKKVDLGTMLLFAAGISLGELLLKTGAATWLANNSLGVMGVTAMSPLMIMITFAIAIFFVRMAFSSSTSATAALIPTILGVLMSVKTPNLPIAGMTYAASYVLLFACLLPVNSPQTMIPYATDTFEAKEFIKVSIPFVIIGLFLWLLFYVTYWRWMGLV